MQNIVYREINTPVFTRSLKDRRGDTRILWTLGGPVRKALKITGILVLDYDSDPPQSNPLGGYVPATALWVSMISDLHTY